MRRVKGGQLGREARSFCLCTQTRLPHEFPAFTGSFSSSAIANTTLLLQSLCDSSSSLSSSAQHGALFLQPVRVKGHCLPEREPASTCFCCLQHGHVRVAARCRDRAPLPRQHDRLLQDPRGQRGHAGAPRLIGTSRKALRESPHAQHVAQGRYEAVFSRAKIWSFR